MGGLGGGRKVGFVVVVEFFRTGADKGSPTVTDGGDFLNCGWLTSETHDGLSLIQWSNDCNWPHFQAAPISHHQQTQSPLLILKVCVFPLKLTSFFHTALLQLARRQGPKSSAGFLKRNINHDLIGWSTQEAVSLIPAMTCTYTWSRLDLGLPFHLRN